MSGDGEASNESYPLPGEGEGAETCEVNVVRNDEQFVVCIDCFIVSGLSQ